MAIENMIEKKGDFEYLDLGGHDLIEQYLT